MFKTPIKAPQEKSACFIFLPTKSEYEITDEHGIALKENDLEKEIEELTRMGEFDSKYFQKKGYSKVLQTYTGYPNQDSEFKDTIESIANLPKEKEILICFSGHGSPGEHGKVGMGHHDRSVSAENKHYLYRISIDELINSLLENGFDKLKDHHIHFQFRCCNSAYVPFEAIEKDKFYLKKHKAKIPDKDKDHFDEEILEKSLIGIFFKKMKDNNFNNISASGVRGFYCPSQNLPQVSSEYPAKNKFNADECTVVINSEGKVEANYLKLLAVPNITSVGGFFMTDEKKPSYNQ